MSTSPFAAAALLASAAFLLPGAGRAAMPDPFAGLEPASADELGRARGGMVIGGIPVNFAVVVRTMVDSAAGPLGLQTLLTVNDKGGLGGAVTTPIGTLGPGGSLSANGGTVAMNLPEGVATILHQVSGTQLSTLIANSQNGANLRRNTELNVELPGFVARERSWHAARNVGRWGADAALRGLCR